MNHIPREQIFTITNETLLAQFIVIPSKKDKQAVVAAVCTTFAKLPYENLTKIIKRDSVIGTSSARRLPDEVIADYLAYRTGGTCFSLTAALIAVFRHFGVESYPILADRRYGPDTHCAALVMVEGKPYLIDLGYLIYEPVLLPEREMVVVEKRFNRIELVPEGEKRIALYTWSGASKRYRLTYKVEPVDAATFSSAWERSFGWEMMTYPVLTRMTATEHYYLQGNQLQVRCEGRTVRKYLDEAESGRFITSMAGISPSIVEQAFQLVRMVPHGKAASR